MGVVIKSGLGGFQELGLENENGWACEDGGRGGGDFRQREQSARALRWSASGAVKHGRAVGCGT